MSTVMDQRQDLNGQELHRIGLSYPLPDFVKNASVDDLCGAKVPSDFADVTRQRFPCHTGAATVLSSIFFQEKRANISPGIAKLIAARLDEAAKYHNVESAVEEMTKRAVRNAQYTENDLPDSDFAVIFTQADGTKERHYPMRNALEVKAAADWLTKYRDDLSFEDRHAIARKVLSRGAAFGANLLDSIYELEKMAGLGVCSSTDAADMIRKRVRAAGHTHRPNALQQEMEKLAKMCEDNPGAVHQPGTLMQLASVVDQYDRTLGERTRRSLERPEDVLFAVTTKAAAELDDSLVGNVLTGNYYKKADLHMLPTRDLADTLGDDFADAVSTASAWVDTEKLARILPTLPLGDAEQFDEVAAAAGVRPFAVKRASVGKSISPVARAELAAQHTPLHGGLWERVKMTT